MTWVIVGLFLVPLLLIGVGALTFGLGLAGEVVRKVKAQGK